MLNAQFPSDVFICSVNAWILTHPRIRHSHLQSRFQSILITYQHGVCILSTTQPCSKVSYWKHHVYCESPTYEDIASIYLSGLIYSSLFLSVRDMLRWLMWRALEGIRSNSFPQMVVNELFSSWARYNYSLMPCPDRCTKDDMAVAFNLISIWFIFGQNKIKSVNKFSRFLYESQNVS